MNQKNQWPDICIQIRHCQWLRPGYSSPASPEIAREGYLADTSREDTLRGIGALYVQYRPRQALLFIAATGGLSANPAVQTRAW